LSFRVGHSTDERILFVTLQGIVGVTTPDGGAFRSRSHVG